MTQKKKYQKYEISKDKNEKLDSLQQSDLDVLSEIDRFQKNKMVIKIVETEFKHNMNLEYELVKAYQPDKLNTIHELEGETKVKVDINRIREQGYLEQLT